MPTLAQARANIVAHIVDGADSSLTPSKFRQVLLDAFDALSFLEGPGFTFLWSTNTAASDPGSTYIKGNNATLGSITTLYVSETAVEGGIAGYLTAVFSGSSAAKAVMILTDVSDHDNFVAATVTASADSGSYRTLTVTVTSTGGSFAADGTLVVQIIPVGDQGATGDVAGPASSVDSEIALFSSTTGKVIKRATTTGLLKATSGVIAAAAAGTDYYAPSGTDVAIADGGTGASTAATAFTNLKQAASETATGVVELATNAETQAGTDTARAITPANLTAKEATSAQYMSNTADRILTTDQAWAAGALVTLTDAATISVDMSTFINATVTLAGNRTLGSPTNEKVGQSGVIYIVQDATGSRTLAYGSDWKFAGGTAPTLTTTANAVDALFYTVRTTNFVVANIVKDVK